MSDTKLSDGQQAGMLRMMVLRLLLASGRNARADADLADLAFECERAEANIMETQGKIRQLRQRLGRGIEVSSYDVLDEAIARLGFVKEGT